MEIIHRTDRAVIRMGNVQYIGLVLALIPITQHATVRNGKLHNFTLAVPRPKWANAPRRINFIPHTTLRSVGKEPGYEYFVYVPAISLSLDIQKEAGDYLSKETVVNLIHDYHSSASIFRY